jgi:hypothetical protein
MEMNDVLLPELFRALNLVAIERQTNGTYYLVTPAPVWLSGALATAHVGERHTLSGAFPFLDDVLHQAAGAWNAGAPASIVAGPFAATVEGDDLLLRATALTVDGRALLVLERLVGAADTRPMLQKARRHVLEGEQLAKQAAKVHAPSTAIAALIARLRGTTLSADQQGLVDELGEAASRLHAVVGDLPAPPPARTRRT